MKLSVYLAQRTRVYDIVNLLLEVSAPFEISFRRLFSLYLRQRSFELGSYTSLHLLVEPLRTRPHKEVFVVQGPPKFCTSLGNSKFLHPHTST